MSTIQEFEAAAAKATQASAQADTWANGPINTTVPTDSGPVPTIAEFNRAAQARVDASIEAIGWVLAGDFTAGCTVTERNQYVLVVGGAGYRWDGVLPKVVASGSSPTPIATGAWVLVGDATLRGDLAAPGGAGLVGGVPVPAADPRFAGGFDTSSVDNKAAVKSVLDSGETVRVQRGTYISTGPATTASGKRVSLEGEGLDSILKMSGNGSMLSVTAAVSAAIRKMRFDVTQPATASTTHGLVFVNQPDLTIERALVMGLAGMGTAIISYSGDLTQIPYSVMRDVRVIGDRGTSSNTNGVLLEDSIYSVLNNIDASGMAAFAIELKNLSEYNRISDSISQGSNGGLYYGSDTVGRYPRYNVASNIISKGCDFGYVPGLGDHNVLAGYLCNGEDSVIVTPEGVRYDGHNNMTIGMSFKASIDGHAVRYQGTSYNNFTSFKYSAGSGSNNRAVVLSSGARRNASEITHPGGELTSISALISNLSGNSMSGNNSNPVWCHTTGEYYGSLNGHWKWVHETGGGSRLSAHKWRYEGVGESYLSIASDGSGSCGLNINNPSGNRYIRWNEASAYWSFDGAGFGVRMYPSTFRPTTDNTMDFGISAFRYKIGYFAQGTQTTSDARLKSEVRPMTDAELSAGSAIAKSIGIFTWLNNESDRLHAGTTVQTVIQCMEEAGLNAFDYGFVCYDKWDDQYEDAFEESVSDTGQVTQVTTGEKILVREAGDLYSLRDHELYKFLVRAQEDRLEKIEKRLADLEAK